MKEMLLLPKKYKVILSFIFLFILSLPAFAQYRDIFVPSSQVKLLKTYNINSRVQAPAAVDPDALYSNVTTYSGSASRNGGAELQAGNTITVLVADSLGLVGAPPFSVGSFSFSVVNFNAADISARPRIRFYAADGPAGTPGTLVTGYTFDPITFTAMSVQVFNTGTLASAFAVTTQAIWAGITFDDNSGATGATLAQMNDLGQGLFDPIDRGSSTNDFFETDAAGSFLADNPTGTTFDFGGAPLANFGWEIVSSVPLPLTLNNFKIQRNGLVNILSWNTSQELNSNYFSIEHSSNGINFTKIGEVKAVGNSSVAQTYQFRDIHPVKGTNYYRLHMVDLNNTGKYSEVKSVKNTGSVNFTIYPNPVKNTIQVNMDADKTEMADVSITDLNGRKVYGHQFSVRQGNNNFPVEVHNFPKGTYYLKVQLSNGTYTNKFNKL